MSELLPCPFCGCEAILKGHHLFFVICTGKDCRGAYEPSVQISSAKEAIANWNRRVDTPQLDWDKATAHLESYEKEYVNLPNGAGRFGLAMVIWPLQARLEKGERTQWLYDEIMEVE